MTLEVNHLVKHFGGVQAVKGVSFSVAQGECVALIGPNGAGKSTTFACIAGQHALTGGQVRWHGARVDALSPAQRLQRGIARTFQVAQTFEALTVLQNLQLLAQYPRGLKAHNVLDQSDPAQSMALLDLVGLATNASTVAHELSYGAKKRLELATALMGLGSQAPLAHRATAPHLLLLDEPAAGLSARERASLMQLVRSLVQDRGLAVLYTEHNMDAVFGVADRVLVLIDGQLAAQGSPQEIARDAAVRARYLGTAFAPPTAGAAHA
jgi:branched-chain amino acid transport system ATP-binding protein